MNSSSIPGIKITYDQPDPSRLDIPDSVSLKPQMVMMDSLKESDSINRLLPVSMDDFEDSDLILDDDEIIELNQGLPSDDSSPQIRHKGTTLLSKTDINSFVGGDCVNSKTTFSFQLPFGNNFKFKNLKFKIPYVSSLFNSAPDDPIEQDIILKLERQESIGTLKEADYFRRIKGRDDVRLRAIKHSLSNKYSEILPISLNNQKDQIAECDEIYSKLEGNIVVLGGYRGSILRDIKTKKRIWIPIKAGFHLRKVNLLLGPTKEDELKASDYIYPQGLLKNIGPVDLCKSFLKKIDNGKTNVKEFGYDWRLSGDLIADQFEEFLVNLYKQTGKPALIVAHSMGGLIAHLVMHRNPSLFRSIVYVGVPSECLNILGPIRFGDAVLLLDKILTAEVNFMMRSSFNFLPLSGKVFYNQETHEPIVLDFFDPDTWVLYNLNPVVAKDRFVKKSGLFDSSWSSLSSKLRSMRHKYALRNPLSPKSETFDDTLTVSYDSTEKSDSPNKSDITNTKEVPKTESEHDEKFSVLFEQAYTYLSETLTNTKKFLLDLDYRPDLESQYPPMAIVYGNTVPSVRGVNVATIQDIKEGIYDNFFYGHGDGVVHQKWLMPERKGFSTFNEETQTGQIVGKFATSMGHVNLMTDLKVMGEALNAVYKAELIWKDKKELESTLGSNLNMIA